MTTTLFRPLFFLGLFLSVALLAGCQGQTGSSGKGEAKLYDVKGKVESLDREKKVVTLDHEDIPGLMKAMKMEFSVADPAVLGGISPGDEVTGKLKSDSGRYVVTSLSKR